MGASLKKALTDQMRQFRTMDVDELVERRMERILQYGKFEVVAQGAEIDPVIAVEDDLHDDQIEQTPIKKVADE